MSTSESITKAIQNWISPVFTKTTPTLIEKGDVAGHAFHGNQYEKFDDAIQSAAELGSKSYYQNKEIDSRNGDRTVGNVAQMVHSSLDAKDVLNQATALAKTDEQKEQIKRATLGVSRDSQIKAINRGFQSLTGTGGTLLDKSGNIRAPRMAEVQSALQKSISAVNDQKASASEEIEKGQNGDPVSPLSLVKFLSSGSEESASKIADFISATYRVAGDNQTALNYRNQSNDLKAEATTADNQLASVSQGYEKLANELATKAEDPSNDSNRGALLDQSSRLFTQSIRALKATSLATPQRRYSVTDDEKAVSDKLNGLRQSAEETSVKSGIANLPSLQSSSDDAIKNLSSATDINKFVALGQSAIDSARSLYDTAQSIKYKTNDPTLSTLTTKIMNDSQSRIYALDSARSYAQGLISLDKAKSQLPSIESESDPSAKYTLVSTALDSASKAVDGLDARNMNSGSEDFVSGLGIYRQGAFQEAKSLQESLSGVQNLIKTDKYVADGDSALANSQDSSASISDRFQSANQALSNYETAKSSFRNFDLTTTNGAQKIAQNIDKIVNVNAKYDQATQNLLEVSAPYFASKVDEYIATNGAGNDGSGISRNVFENAITSYQKLYDQAVASGNSSAQSDYKSALDGLKNAKATEMRAVSLRGRHQL